MYSRFAECSVWVQVITRSSENGYDVLAVMWVASSACSVRSPVTAHLRPETSSGTGDRLERERLCNQLHGRKRPPAKRTSIGRDNIGLPSAFAFAAAVGSDHSAPVLVDPSARHSRGQYRLHRRRRGPLPTATARRQSHLRRWPRTSRSIPYVHHAGAPTRNAKVLICRRT
jgi:hypothetical protein